MYYRNKTKKKMYVNSKKNVLCVTFIYFFQTLCSDHSRVKYNILVCITLYLKITIYD